MGQSLSAPPSVAGWDGGPGWINSTAMLARANVAMACSPIKRHSGRGGIPGTGWPAWSWAAGSLAGFFIDLLAEGALEPEAREQIEKAATNKSSADDAAAREVVRLILTRQSISSRNRRWFERE